MIYLVKNKNIFLSIHFEKNLTEILQSTINFRVKIFNTNCSQPSIIFKIHLALCHSWLFFKKYNFGTFNSEKNQKYIFIDSLMWYLQRQLRLNIKFLYSATTAEYFTPGEYINREILIATKKAWCQSSRIWNSNFECFEHLSSIIFSYSTRTIRVKYCLSLLIWILLNFRWKWQ